MALKLITRTVIHSIITQAVCEAATICLHPSTPHAAAQHALLPVAVGTMNIHNVRDRQMSDAHHRLMPPPYQGGGITKPISISNIFPSRQLHMNGDDKQHVWAVDSIIIPQGRKQMLWDSLVCKINTEVKTLFTLMLLLLWLQWQK